MNHEYQLLHLSAIAPSPTNPRKAFPVERMAELVNSIRTSGVLQPVLVRPLPASRVADTAHLSPRPSFELVCGHRRHKACSVIDGMRFIPAIVRDLTDAEVIKLQLVENLQREDLSPLEEADGYDRLMHAQDPALTVDEVAALIGKSRSYVYGRLKLLNLCTEGQQAMHEGWLDASRALLVARLPSSQVQAQALKNLRHSITGEALSYREAAALIQRQYMLRLNEAPFKITDATLVPSAGSCKACPKRTGADPDLFADVQGADVCTDEACFRAKEHAHQEAQLKQARESGATIIEGREAKSLVPHSWSTKVEGYLRLDEADDSPTGKPLRATIGKLMEAEGIQAVMVANPHRDGELIACIDHATASRLLAKKGHQDKAEQLQAEAQRSAEAAAEAEQRKHTEKFENAWRWAVLEQAWAKINSDDELGYMVPDSVIRWVCLHYLIPTSQEMCGRLCKLLGLGDVAPRQGLIDWIKAEETDVYRAMALLVMFADREWRTWGDPDNRDNPALMAIASADPAFVDVNAIKARVQADHTAAIEAKTKAKKTADTAREATAAPSPEAPLPLPPAAQAKGGAGGKAKGKGKGAKTPAAPAAPKLSAQDAMSGIAAAMQGNEGGADCGPLDTNPGAATAAPGNDGPAHGPDAGAERAEVGGFAVGGRVKVTRSGHLKGRVGTVTAINDEGEITLDLDGVAPEDQPPFWEAFELEAWPFPKGGI